jgi:hypothetical protein
MLLILSHFYQPHHHLHENLIVDSWVSRKLDVSQRQELVWISQ